MEATFVIRMYAEFEANLRDCWKNRLGNATQPPMKDLLAAIAARSRMPDDRFREADLVRQYRNSLIHSSKEGSTVVSLDEARSSMSRYLGRLPFDW